MDKVISINLNVLEGGTVLSVNGKGLFTDVLGFEPGSICSLDHHCGTPEVFQNCETLLVTKTKNTWTPEAEVTGEGPFVSIHYLSTTNLYE